MQGYLFDHVGLEKRSPTYQKTRFKKVPAYYPVTFKIMGSASLILTSAVELH